MFKRLAVITTLVGAPMIGVLAPAAHADDPAPCNGLAIHVHANVNGNEQGTDQCVPLSAPSLP